MRFRNVTALIGILLLMVFPVTTLLAAGAQEEEPADVPQVRLDYGEPSGDLEIFSWWAGDEGPPLEALIDLYEERHPDVSVINATVAGGAGVDAKAVLKTRMLGGDPPDTFQVHAGQELIGTWVVADRMVDLTPLFEEHGWFDVFPDQLIEMASTDEGIWSVPLNIHRDDVMWYMPENLQEWGVDVPQTWDEFFEVAEELEAQGVTPMSLGTTWTVNHLWQVIAASTYGPDRYEQLWTGEADFDSPEGVESWEILGRILDYANEDFASLTWQQATDMVVDGEAAFNVMGDWAAGYKTTTLELEPGTDFGWAEAPGTHGAFIVVSDSFGMPIGAPNPAANVAWLETVGSLEGQDTFNPLKGSIAPRTDSDLSLYNEYQQSAFEDFQSQQLISSLTHGTAANETFMDESMTVTETFLSNRNAEQAAQAMQGLAVEHGIAD